MKHTNRAMRLRCNVLAQEIRMQLPIATTVQKIATDILKPVCASQTIVENRNVTNTEHA